MLLILLANIQWTGDEINKPEKVWIRIRHPQNLSCYIASANLKFHGDTEKADLLYPIHNFSLAQKVYMSP